MFQSQLNISESSWDRRRSLPASHINAPITSVSPPVSWSKSQTLSLHPYLARLRAAALRWISHSLFEAAFLDGWLQMYFCMLLRMPLFLSRHLWCWRAVTCVNCSVPLTAISLPPFEPSLLIICVTVLLWCIGRVPPKPHSHHSLQTDILPYSNNIWLSECVWIHADIFCSVSTSSCSFRCFSFL